MSMGMSPPREAAPAYEEVVHQPRLTRNGYASVPQAETNSDYIDDDLEQQHSHSNPQQHQHQHHNHNNEPGITLEPITLDSRDNDLTEPHTHCEACDHLLERRERRRNEKHCCTMVAATFIMAFICIMIVAIVSVPTWRH